MFLSKIPLIVDGGPKGLIKRLFVVAVAVAALLAGGLMAHIAVLGNELPDLSSMENYDPALTSKVFDRHGNLVARFYEERRTVVAIEQIPEHVKRAFIAAEDEDFYNHKGIDYWAIVRAVIYQARHKLIGGPQSGGSTITQQTAKTFLLTPERSMSRKIKEMILAKKIEERFSKDHILYLYLNQIYFGNGAYGVEEAARTYYGRSVDKLTIGQAAVLASIPKSPSRINPWADPRRVRVRRGYVLEQMRANGFIDEAQEQRAKEEPVRVEVAPPEFLDVAPYYAEAIRQVLVDKTSPEEVARGGLTVYAALDGGLQKAANVGIDKGLRELDKRQGYRGPLVRLDPDVAKELLALLDDERGRRFPADETPDLKLEAAEGRAIWDLARVKHDDVQRILKAAAAQDDDDDDVSDAEKKLDAQLAAKAGLSTSPALRQVRTTRLKIGSRAGAVVKEIDNAGKKVVVDLGTTDAVMPFASMAWARPFSPEKSTERPKAPSDVVKRGDIVLVSIEKILPGRASSKDKGGKVSALSPGGPGTSAKAAVVEVALEQDPKAQGALVSIDPADHRVLALVGGSDFAASPFNRATQAVRQAGSSFKPFIYATGIETRLFSSVGFLETRADGSVSHRLITDAPKVFFDRWTGKKWAPQNSSGRFLGDITTRTCLTHSVNTCSISILEKVGIDAVLDVAAKVHLNLAEEPFPKNQTLALGTGGVHLLDLVNAYAVFPDGGRWAPPVLIEKVKKRDGSILFEAPPLEHTQVFAAQTASIMADMMKSVVESGTAMRARELKRPVAGKTGTTDEARSTWFVGFTPDIVTGVYVGFDDNKTLGRAESGGRAAVPIWMRFMNVAVADQPAHDFVLADGVVRKSVDIRTGLLARSEAALLPGELPDLELNDDGDPIPKVLPAGVIAEVFVQGTEPVQTADDAPPPPLELQERGGLAP